MPRPPDPDRKAATLSRAADYVLENGLVGLTLRPLARAIGTSPRMLLYDFGSKEQLLRELLAEIRNREAMLLATDATTLADVWRWIAAPEREPFLRLFFEIYVQALDAGDAAPFVREWLDHLRSMWGVDSTEATLFIAVVRGLLLDRLATGDRARTDAALARFTELVPE